MVSSVLIGAGTEPSFSLHSGSRQGRAGKLCRLGSWLHPGWGGESRGGWDLSSGKQVQRCLAWVLRNSRLWVGSKGVPFLVAENSNSERPACLSGLVADSPQDSSVVYWGAERQKWRKESRIHSLIRQQFGTVYQKPVTRAYLLPQ